MKLLFSDFYPPVDLKESAVVTISIEDPVFLRTVILDIRSQLEGNKGTCVLSDNGVPLDMAKNLELLPDIIPFSGNRKNLLNKVLTAVEKNGMENIEEVQKLSAEIETYLLSISEDWPLSFDMGKITPASLLKLAGAQIELSGESPLEDLLTYMDLTAEMEREKIFCLLNLHCYFSVEELDAFFHSVALQQHRLLVFEGSEYPCMHEEKKIVIDKDLCQIIL